MNVIINDLPLSIPFRVYDITTGHYVFSIMSPDDGGDCPTGSSPCSSATACSTERRK